jgi:hypothetical protein
MAAAREHLQVRTGYALSATKGSDDTSLPSQTFALLMAAARRVGEVFSRGPSGDATPPAVRNSLVYGLCMQHDARTLWERYFEFRMNPCARTWRRLQRLPVPWLGNRRVQEVVAPFLADASKRTPDTGLVKRTLMSFADAPADSGVDTTRMSAYRGSRR